MLVEYAAAWLRDYYPDGDEYPMAEFHHDALNFLDYLESRGFKFDRDPAYGPC